MAKAIEKWNEIQSDERFQGFTPEQQIQTRNQFFDRYIAPKIDDDVREIARNQFYNLSGIDNNLANMSVEPQQPSFNRRESREGVQAGSGTIGGAIKNFYGGVVDVLDKVGADRLVRDYDDDGNKTIPGAFSHGKKDALSNFQRQLKGAGVFALDKVQNNQVGSHAYDYLVAVHENPNGQKAQELREIGVNVDKLLSIDMSPRGRNRKPSQRSIQQTEGWQELMSALKDQDTKINRYKSNLQQSAYSDRAVVDSRQSGVDPWSATGIVQNATGAVGNMMPALATSAVATPAAGAALMGSQVFGDAYVDGLERGLDQDQAQGRAALFAVTESLSERIPLGILTKEGGTLLKRFLKSSGAEGIQEAVTEAVQMGIDRNILNEQMTWREAVNNMAYAGLLGAIAGGVLSVPGHIGSIENERRSALKSAIQKSKPTESNQEQTLDELFGEDYGQIGAQFAQEQSENETNVPMPNTYDFDPDRPDPRHDRGAGPLANEYANELAESGSRPVFQPDDEVPDEYNPATPDQSEVAYGSDARQLADEMQRGEIGEGVPVLNIDRPEIIPPKDPDDPNLKEYATYIDSELITHYAKGGKYKIPGVIKRDINEAVAKAIDPRSFRKDGGWFISQNKLKRRNPTPFEEAQAIYDKLPAGFKGSAKVVEQLRARVEQLNKLPELDDKTQKLIDLINKRIGNTGKQKPVNQQPTSTPKNIKPIEQLVGAKPRYNYGKKSFALSFERELDKFAFILAQNKKSKEDASFLYHLMEQTGLSEAEAREYGNKVKDFIKSKAKDSAPGKISVPIEWNNRPEIEFIRQDNINEKAQEAATSTKNDLPQPTEAQKEAGNYKKGKINIQGLDISIENPKGSKRTGTDSSGKKWSVTMKSHYGYIRKSIGADGEQVDVFVGEKPESQKVFIIDQRNADGSFDEHKVMLGFSSKAAAKRGYLQNYSKGWRGLGNVETMSMDQFKQWLSTGATTSPAEDARIESEPRQEAPAPKDNQPEEKVTSTVSEEISQEDEIDIESYDYKQALKDIYGLELNLSDGNSGWKTISYDPEILDTAFLNEGWKKDNGWFIKGNNWAQIYYDYSYKIPVRLKWESTREFKQDKPVEPKKTNKKETSAVSNKITDERIYYKTGTISGAQYSPMTEVLEDYNGILLKSGVKPKTSSGRPEVAAFPSYSLGSPKRKYVAIMDIKRWLFREALNESMYRGESEQSDKFRELARNYKTSNNDDVQEAQNYIFDYDVFYKEKPPKLESVTPQAKEESKDKEPVTPQAQTETPIARSQNPEPASETPKSDKAKLLDGEEIITHTTKKGKSIRGVARQNITKDQAKEIDPYTFKKDGGWFIRIKHLDVDAKRETKPLPEKKSEKNDAENVKDESKASKPKDQTDSKLKSAGRKISKGQQAAIDDLKQLLKSRSGTMTAGIDPELMFAIAKVGGYTVAEVGVSFAVWVEDMITILRKNGIRDADVVPHMKEAYAAISANPEKYGVSEEQADAMDTTKVLRSTDLEQIIEDMDNAEQRRSSVREGRERGASRVQEGGAGQGRVQPTQAERGARDDDVGGVQPEVLETPELSGDSSRDGRAATSEVGGGEPGTDRDGVPSVGRKRSGGKKSSNARTGRPRSSRGIKKDGKAPSNRTYEPFHIDDPLKIVGGGQVARFEKNKSAIELYQTLTEENRAATPEEQKTLAGYTGWGSFGQELFQGAWKEPQPKDKWEARSDWLRSNVSQKEWESIQRSITNAHYTDPPTVLAMWEMVKRMGFKSGKVLEPSMGIGNFFSMMPKELKQRSLLTGIELDELTGGMAKKLFPEENISIKGYQDSKTPDNFYDLIIGNWPFEDTVIADRKYQKFNPFLHDYFFLKAIDQVRPGGIVMGITSKGTMDKKDNTIRRELAKKAELVAAYRLPSGAFQEYAGTKVVTDIIILKKRPEKLANAEGINWINSSTYKVNPGEEFYLNDYYNDNKDHIIGTLGYGHGTTFRRPGMIVTRPDNMQEEIKRIIDITPKNVYEKDAKAEHVSYITNNIDDRVNSLVESNGDLYISKGEHLALAQDVKSWRVKSGTETESRKQQFSRLIKMRRVYGELITAEVKGNIKEADKLRPKLKKLYESYKKVSKGQWVASREMKYLKSINDPFYTSLAALEKKDSKTKKMVASDVFEKSTIRSPISIENPSVLDAYVLSRNKDIIPDIDQIANLAKKDKESVKKELIERGAVFETPNGDIMPADIYLSGDVREKLFDAEVALEDGNKAMEHNIKELKKVIPKDIPYFNIEVQLGATWIPQELYKSFIADLLNRNDNEGIEIRYSAGRWSAKLAPGLKDIPEASTGYGTEHVGFSTLMNYALRNQRPTLRYKDPKTGTTYILEEETLEVNQRIARIRERFQEWIWEDAERKVELETQYNKVRNSYATPNYDGSFLRFPGMALKFGDNPLDLRQHQRNAIWRALVTRKSLNAHEVGTGKTFTMGGIAIESRRYGIAKKPLILAHNANSKSVAEEIQQMYPAAKVLYIQSMPKDKLEIRMMQIANEDWDAIVLPHSLIDRMTLSEETLMSIAQEEIDSLEAEAQQAAAEDGASLIGVDLEDPEQVKKIRSSTAKDLVKQRNRIIENIRKQGQKASKPGAITFENLGIDMILVDEAHEFKKPPISTQMKMKGLNTSVSNKSIALSFLTKYVRQMNHGGNIHLFTGTPITNTLTEAFHMMKYIMHEEMAEEGIEQWDGWFGSFAQEVDDVELNAAGEYEPVTRLAAFINVPELRQMLGQYMDVVFAEDMPEMQPRKLSTGKTADQELTDAELNELLNGRTEGAKDRPYKKIVNVNADMTDTQLSYFEQIKGYARDFRNASAKEKRRIMLSGDVRSPIVYEGLANKVSVDARLLHAEQLAGQEGKAKDDPNSKPSRIIKQLLEIYKSDSKATQAVFTQIGISKSLTKTRRTKDGEKHSYTVPAFSTVYDMVERLVQQGVPREQIAVVTGTTSKDKKLEIAKQMRNSEIRIVFGSSQSLGVGVNMQDNLRAMHHMDAPWMPGDLEQRNGRGHRQKNQYNTVYEYRYLTDKIDGRRWQVLAAKDRFIKAFLKSKGDQRNIEGDAASEEDSDILSSFSEAAGDPRILIREKLNKKIVNLQNKERAHSRGIADAKRMARRLKENIDYLAKSIKSIEQSNVIENLKDAYSHLIEKSFKITIEGKTYKKKADANNALVKLINSSVRAYTDAINDNDEYTKSKMKSGRKVGKVGDFEIHTRAKINGPVFELKTGTKSVYVYMNGNTDLEDDSIEFLSIDQLMSKIRKFYTKQDRLQQKIDDANKSLERAIQVSQEPFQQQDKLTQTLKDFDALLEDMDRNPVPPPVWLRNGAPIESEIRHEGKELEVTGHQWSQDGFFVIAKDSEKSYRVPYLEAKDSQGMAIYDEMPFEPPIVDAEQGLTESDRVSDDQADPFDADRNATQAELDTADVSAKEINGEVVYQRGNIGLIQAYASGSGDILYVPFFKKSYARVDVDNFTGVQLDNDTKEQLKKAKQKLEKAAFKKHAENPFITFNNQIETSENVSKEVAGIVREWVKILGIEDNIYLTTFDDARANHDKFTGPHRPIGFAVHQTYENGQTRILDDGSHYLAFENSSSKTKMLEVIAHELGHIHQKAAFHNAPDDLKKQIIDEHSKWVKGLKDKTGRELVDSLRAKTTAKGTNVAEDALAKNATPYWTSFSEWYADQVSRWAMTSDQPQTAVQKFFKRLGQALKSFYLKAKNAKYLPNATFKNYLESVKESISTQSQKVIDESVNQSRNEFQENGADTGENADVVASRIDEALKASRGNILKRAIDSIRSNKATEAFKRNALGVLTLRQMGEVYAKIQPKVNEYVATVDKMIKMRNHMAYDASDIVESWQKWAAKNREHADTLHDLMHQATLYEVDPSLGYTNRANVLRMLATRLRLMYANYATNPTLANMIRDEIELIDQKIEEERERSRKHVELNRIWRTLPEEAQETYRKVRDHYKTNHEKLKTIFEAKLAQAQLEDNQKEVMRQVFNVQFKVKEISGPYFPLARFGKYWVEFNAGERHFTTFETELEQKNFIKALDAQNIESESGLLTDTSNLGKTTASFVNDVIAAVDETVSANPNAGHDLKDMIYQMYLKSIPERSMMRNRIHRKGVKGFSKNAIRAFADNMMKQSYQLARLEYSEDMENLIGDMEKDAKSGDNEKGRVYNEMVKRHEWVMNPSNSNVANFATSLGFMYMLSTSPAAAGVNLTQSFTTGVPSMAADIGISMTKAATQLVKNSRKFNWKDGRISESNMTDDEKRAMEEWIDMGMIDSTGSHELLGIAENGGYQYSDRTEKIMRFMGGMFHRAEQFNREVTALSAYQLARKKGKNHEESVQLAAKITWEAHFDYANHNRARVMQSNVAKVAMQFKQYSQSMTYYLLRNAQQGLLSGNWTSTEAKAARKKLVGSLGITAAMGGVSTMPLWALYALANFVFDDDEDKPWDAKTEFNAYLSDQFGKDAADWIMYGIGGAGFAGRISLDGMWLRDPSRDLDSHEMYAHMMPQILGPVLGGIVPNMFRGVGYLREGEYQKAVEKLSPKFIRDLSKAQRYATEGQVNRQGAVLKGQEDFSALEIVGQAVGFSDDDVIKQYIQNNAIMDYSIRIKRRRKLLLNKYYAAWYAKDRQALKDALSDIQKWNRTHFKHPGIQIKPSTINRSVKSREARRTEAVDGLNVNKNLMYLIDQLDLAG